MAKAERLLTTVPLLRASPSADRQCKIDGSRFLAAIAADASADEVLFEFPGLTRQ
jgi:hypothetical protein